MTCKSDKQRRAMFAKMNKVYKTVSYNSPNLRPVGDKLVMFKGKMYETKEDLKKFPKKVRLIRLNDKINVKVKR